MKNREKNLWKAISFMDRLEQKIFERKNKIRNIYESWKELKNIGSINKQLPIDDNMPLSLTIKETQDSAFNMVFLPSGSFYTGIKDKAFEKECKKTIEEIEKRNKARLGNNVEKMYISARKKVDIERPFFIMDTCVNESLFLDVFMSLNDNLEYAIDIMNLNAEMKNVSILNNFPNLHQNKVVDKFSWLSAILFCNILSQKYNYEKCYEIKIPDTLLNRKYKEGLLKDNRHTQYSMNYVEAISHYVEIDVVWNKNANGFRLPTSREWEYASKYPNDCLFFGGKSALNDEGYFKHNPCFTEFNQAQKYKYKLRIDDRARFDYEKADYGSVSNEFDGDLKIFKPNVSGIFDMLRYEEICFDVYCEDSYNQYCSYNKVDIEKDTYINNVVLGKDDIVNINFAYGRVRDEDELKKQNKLYKNITRGSAKYIMPNNSLYYENSVMRGSLIDYQVTSLKALRPVRNAW